MLQWLGEFFDKILSIFPRFKQIGPNEMGVVVWLGRYKRIVGPGYWAWWPLFSTLEYQEVVDQIQDLDELTITFENGETLLIDPAIRFEIINIDKAFYNVQNVYDTLYIFARATLSELVMKHQDFNSVAADLKNITTNCTEIVSTEAKKWGVNVTSIMVTDFVAPKPYKFYGQNKSAVIEHDDE